MRELKELREKIDEIDDKILKLLEERVKVCKEIGKIKKKYNIGIEDRKREEEVLKNKGIFKEIFKEIIKICKKVQG